MAVQSAPRAVFTPRADRAAAISRSDFAPARRTSSITGSTLPARRSASPMRRAGCVELRVAELHAASRATWRILCVAAGLEDPREAEAIVEQLVAAAGNDDDLARATSPKLADHGD